MGVAWGCTSSLLAVLVLAAVPLTACAPVVCSAVGYVSGVSIRIAPARASTTHGEDVGPLKLTVDMTWLRL